MDRLLAALYRRTKSQPYLFWAATHAWVFSVNLFVVVVAAGLAVLYLDLSAGEFTRIVLVAQAVSVAGIAAGTTARWSSVRPLLRWIAGAEDAPPAPEAFRLALALPRILSRGGVWGVSILHLAITDFYIRHVAGLELPGFIAVALGVQLAITIVWCLVVFGIEFLFRPVVEETARMLSGDAEQAVTWKIRWRILLPVPLFAAFVGAATPAITLAFDGSAQERFLAAVVSGIGVSVVLVFPLIWVMITEPLTKPVGDLTAAAERVRTGDLTTPVPVTSGDELGVLATAFNRMQVGLQERESLREDLQASRARIVAATDEERRRMERDLHDGAQQHLVLLKMKLGILESTTGDDPDARAQLEELKEDLSRALAELRDLAHGIYPATLEHEGLPAALRDAVERCPLKGTLEAAGAPRFPPELEAAVYFCCLEALQNAAKHAGENAEVTVRLREQEGSLHFEVADNGHGFDPASGNGSSGLQNMADRIGALGGELRIESRPGMGTRVRGAVPVVAS